MRFSNTCIGGQGNSESSGMRSIWTRVHGPEHDLKTKLFKFYSFSSPEDRPEAEADQMQTPELGGGEGAQTQTQPDLKKENEKLNEAQTETPTDIQLNVKEEVKPEPVTDATIEHVEAKLEPPKEVISENVKEAVASETKVEPIAEGSKQTVIKTEANGVAGYASVIKEQGDWQQRETELLKKIDELENVKKERTQDSFELELKVRDEEIDLLKARVKNLETELQAALSKPSAGKNHEMIENIKQQHEELLSKARGMIFDKTKMVKNQELQIEALNSQVLSLKDINQITKDLLEIRNSEIKAMEDRLQAMEARFKAEKERYGLVLERAQTSSNINDDLRKEYETQLALFKQLREKYDQRVQALVAENERLKASNPQPANGTDAGTSG